jgi:hypothetical protein
MSRITLTLEGVTWAEIKAQCRDIVATPEANLVPAARQAFGQDVAPVHALPFPPPGSAPSLPSGPPGGVPVCPDHGHTLKLKPAGTNRQGTPYSAGYRCPEQGCRTFVPVTVTQ